MLDCVTIMAGGVGTRLWPASNRHCPKQFLPLGPTGESLLERTLQRSLALGPRLLLLVAPQQQLPLLRQCCTRLSVTVRRKLHILLEPEGRNTAAALALAACWVKGRLGEGACQLVLAADHLIQPLDKFTAAVEQATELAQERLVLFGITPSYPETGYGYVERGVAFRRGFLVQRFIEKPDYASVQQLLASGNYCWNSGMFCYSTKLFLQQLAQYCPQVHTPLTALRLLPADNADIPCCHPDQKLAAVYSQLPQLSIDYALMERSDKMAMVEGSFDWNDIGSWDAMAVADHDHSLSVPHSGQVCQINANNNYVCTQMPVALCGVDDLIVIEANGQLLICKRGASQLVKQVQLPLKLGKTG